MALRPRRRGLRNFYRRKERQILGWIFLVPMSVAVFLVIIYPTLDSMILSLHQWNGFTPRSWVGLRNYSKLFTGDTVFPLALANNFKLAAVVTLFSVIIGFALAYATFAKTGLSGQTLRVVLLIPYILPLTAVGVLWAFILNPSFGLLNRFLELLDLGALTHAWLGESALALYSVAAVGIWKTFGFNMLLFHAGLQNIPVSLYESAEIDGASTMQKVLFITLPLLRPVFQLTIVLSAIFGLKTFDLVYVMTLGGPGRSTTTVSMWLIENSFTYYSFGYGAAMAMVLLAVIVVVVTILRRLIPEGEVQF